MPHMSFAAFCCAAVQHCRQLEPGRCLTPVKQRLHRGLLIPQPQRTGSCSLSALSSHPGQAENDKIRSQSIYRGHNGHIVFLGFLSDNTTVVSVDENGQVRGNGLRSGVKERRGRDV